VTLLKREISILLLCCFTTYHFGYYIFYYSYKFKIESDWASQIFNSELAFDGERLMKIPLSLPYRSDQRDFQEASYNFEKNGVVYRVVKQRYSMDTLQLVYVPDEPLRKLELSVTGWIAYVTDNLPQKNDNNRLLLTNILKDFLLPMAGVSLKFAGNLKNENNCRYFFTYKNIDKEIDNPPPKFFRV